MTPTLTFDPQPQKTHSQNARDFDQLAKDFDSHQLFTDDYYRQLRDLGVLVDGADLSRDSLGEFEEIESRVASRMADPVKEEDETNRDLIGEYLESEREREGDEEEEGWEKAEMEDREKRVRGILKRPDSRTSRPDSRQSRPDSRVSRPDSRISRPDSRISRADSRPYSRQSESGMGADNYSAVTISSRSFPDEEFDNHSQHLGSQAGSLSQRTTGDDEIFFITSRILPESPADVRKSKSERERDRHRRGSQSSRAGSIRAESRGQSPGSARGGKSQPDDQDDYDARSQRSDSARAINAGPATNAEIVFARQKKAEQAAVKRMGKAKSQESFFEGAGLSLAKQPGDSVNSQEDRPIHQKRLLPQPSSIEQSQSFRVKSKSQSNIANRSGPVKPTHMTVNEIRSMTNMDDEGMMMGEELLAEMGEAGDRSSGELTERLTAEANKRKQATELVQQLQHVSVDSLFDSLGYVTKLNDSMID